MKTETECGLSVTFTMVCVSIPLHFQKLFYSMKETIQSTVTVVFYAELRFYQKKELRSLTEHVSEAVNKMNHLPDLNKNLTILEYDQQAVIEKTQKSRILQFFLQLG